MHDLNGGNSHTKTFPAQRISSSFQNTALEVMAKKTGILLRNEDSCTKAVTAENLFIATLVALQFTPVSHLVDQ